MGTQSRVVMSGEMDKAGVLASEALPDAGQGHGLPGVDRGRGRQTTSAGSFTPDTNGHLVAVLEGSATGVDKFMITMEPPGGSEHPSGEMLAEIDA